MRITRKGQVTIPHAIRKQTGMHPLSEVEFEVRPSGDVVLWPVPRQATDVRAAFAKVRGSANATQFKGMGTDEFMALLRG